MVWCFSNFNSKEVVFAGGTSCLGLFLFLYEYILVCSPHIKACDKPLSLHLSHRLCSQITGLVLALPPFF